MNRLNVYIFLPYNNNEKCFVSRLNRHISHMRNYKKKNKKFVCCYRKTKHYKAYENIIQQSRGKKISILKVKNEWFSRASWFTLCRRASELAKKVKYKLQSWFTKDDEWVTCLTISKKIL